jgi:tetratricopeptide (TPR) repeat protein
MHAVWTSYSARAAAQLIGLPESSVRSLIRDGIVGAVGEVPARLSFRDLATLRVVKTVFEAGVPARRARRELAQLVRGLGGRALSEVALEVRAGRVWVRGQGPIVGQLELALEPVVSAPTPAGELHELPSRVEPPPPLVVAAPLTADEWAARALALEDSDTAAAIDAYRRSLRLRPDSTEAWINLGRLHAEHDDPTAARDCFRAALDLDPADATAIYNLGVVSQDAGREAEAVELYRRALELDPTLAEAHYNLATIFDQTGDSRAAIRHINEYRKLTR